MSHLILGGIALLGLLALVGFWLWLGPSPRRRRRFRHAQHLLQNGEWRAALDHLRGIRQKANLSGKWLSNVAQLEGRCRLTAMQQALEQGEFESAMEESLQAAVLLRQDEADAFARVIEAMLAELRRQFAITSPKETRVPHELADRLLRMKNNCHEAYFWQGLCYLRDGKTDKALDALQTARTGEVPKPSPFTQASTDPSAVPNYGKNVSGFIDPSLYIGAILLRDGRAKESLRFLTEANRMDGNCPFVTCQVGCGIIGAGGDSQLAVRALERALGPTGFGLWPKQPERAWVEGFPQNRSWIRKLAEENPYPCPLWGRDCLLLFRQAKTALGVGFYRLGNFKESKRVFTELMREAAPSLAVLRGLGFAQARLGEYDEAFVHLRSVHERETTKDPFTAGYLALCGAKGKPTRPEDKANNIKWAMQLVRQFNPTGDAEWAGLVNAVFAEARAANVPMSKDEQLYLCSTLASVDAVDLMAAEAYHHLQATHPDAVRPEFAFLYCQAAQLTKHDGNHNLALFETTFNQAEEAQKFFDKRQWDLGAIEFAFLKRSSELEPGSFPKALGPDYPQRGEATLLARSKELEANGQLDQAQEHAEVLHRLAPQSPTAHDRLAHLQYLHGNIGESERLLRKWCELRADDPWPLVRLAVVQQQLGQSAECIETLRNARELADDELRGHIAFLGARLTLALAVEQPGNERSGNANLWSQARQYLDECLQRQPDNTEALWMAAAVRSCLNDQRGLTELADRFDRDDVSEPRFHFLSAVCQLAAKNFDGVHRSCRRIDAFLKEAEAGNEAAKIAKALQPEVAYLDGLAFMGTGKGEGAVRALGKAALGSKNASCNHARAQLGKMYFDAGMFDYALQWWKSMDAEKRTQWNLELPLSGTFLLAAVQELADGEFHKAAEHIREAGKAGSRDPRLSPLLLLSLIKAGQQRLYRNDPDDHSTVVETVPNGV